jgi:peptidoglycan endopeptidase LytE
LPRLTWIAGWSLSLGLTAGLFAAASAAAASTYTVQPGDTLSSIAQRFDTTVTALEAANGIGASGFIRIGEVLRLPVAAGGAGGAATARTYVVRPGDTMWSIASRLGVSVAALEAANGLGANAILQIGQRLVVPGSAPAASGSGASAVGAATRAGGVYVVRPGDTLSGIAQRLGVPLSRLYSLNDLGPDSVLRIGERLRTGLQPSAEPRAATHRPTAGDAPSLAVYRVQPGDTLASIAARLGITLAALVRDNPGVSPGDLQIGQILHLPSAAAAAAGATAVALSFGQRVVSEVERFVGVPYVYGGSSPSGFDCSGLVWYVFGQLGVNLPRDATDQFYAGRSVPRSALQPGDVVFFDTTGGISHDGIYIGNDQFIDAPAPGQSVQVDSLSDAYWQDTFIGAKAYGPSA